MKKNNKNIFIICLNSQQPPYNTMLRYHNWGKELVKRGYNITIITSNWVHNTNIDVAKKINSNQDVVDGVKYYYINTPFYQGNGIKRIINFIEFSIKLIIPRIKLDKPDIIISTGAINFPFVKLYYPSIPIITDIVDLWPQSIIEYAGYRANHPMIRIMFWLEKISYIRSNALIFSMEGGKDYIKEQKYKKKINPRKVFHINMGCDISQKDQELKSVKYDLGWDLDKFNIVYCGSIRQANQVKQICVAAKEIMKRDIKDVFFHIYGNGDELEELKEYVDTNSITNIKFYGRIEKENIPAILANSKANILTYKQVDLMKYGGSQGKLFDYLASGKPILCNAVFGYNLIERYNCGVITEAQTPKAFADAVEKLHDMSNSELLEMGERARQAAEKYDQPILVNQLCKVFEFVEKR